MSLRTIKKRRNECKTDYKARLILLKSPCDRIVVRKTNRYIILQQVESKQSQDRVVRTTSSKDLIKEGWDEKLSGSLKSVSAAYLVGLLMAKKIGEGKFIVDIGLATHQKGGRIYAAVKGLKDGGLNISSSDEIFPSEERIKGEHLKEDVRKIIEKIKEKILKNGK
jgi:large subunit ribosomal protein L18